MNATGRKTGTGKWFPWDFLIVTFAFSWLSWLPAVLETSGVLRLPIPTEAFFLLGIFGPLVGAIAATVRRSGWTAARLLLARAIDVRIGAAWWLLILIIPPVLSAMALLGFRLAGGQVGELEVLRSPWIVLPSILFMLLLGGGQEEFGWRGYALDILQARWGALVASIVLGFIWGVWHLPLFFVEKAGQYYMPLWVFLLASPALSILTTWIYNSTGKRLFAALLFHATVNAGMDLFPPIQKVVDGDQRAFLILCALYWVWALLVIAVFGARRLARSAA
jgi:membrane protease YdiL (CAAX protease family)